MNGESYASNCDFITKTIQDLAKKLQYKSFDIHLAEKFSKGENYLGEIRRATVSGVKANGAKEELKLIVKTFPNAIRGKDDFPLDGLYRNEELMYKEYLPELIDLQNKAELADDDLQFKIPKCYFASSREEQEILLFEDMNEKGYVMCDRFKTFDVAHLRMIAGVLGSFHALSFAIKEKISKSTYDGYIDRIHNIQEHPQFTDYIKTTVSSIEKYMDSEDNVKKFKEYTSSDFLDDHRRVIYCDRTRPYNILVHGDFWTNNFLFRYLEGKPESIVMLDWQIVKYSTPVVDLIYLLYICIDEETRNENWDLVLKTYYDSLKNRLVALDCDPEKCFPEAALHSEMKTFQRFALINSMIMLPLILNSREDSVDLNDIMEGGAENYSNVVKHSNLFKQRINGIVRHLTACNAI